MKRTMMLVAAALLALAACEDKKTDATKPDDPAAKNAANTATPVTTAATPATAAPAPVTISDSDLVTPADFEETAEKSITKANYKAELSTLESDIAKN